MQWGRLLEGQEQHRKRMPHRCRFNLPHHMQWQSSMLRECQGDCNLRNSEVVLSRRGQLQRYEQGLGSRRMLDLPNTVRISNRCTIRISNTLTNTCSFKYTYDLSNKSSNSSFRSHTLSFDMTEMFVLQSTSSLLVQVAAKDGLLLKAHATSCLQTLRPLTSQLQSHPVSRSGDILPRY